MADTRRIAYTLTLTDGERRALEFMTDRGYAGALIEAATEIDYPEAGGAIYRYTESAAWDAVGRYDDDDGTPDPDFGTCAAPELLAKLYAFRDGII